VRRLEGGGDAQPGETGQDFVGCGLDVLDPVGPAPVGSQGCDGVQDMSYGGVPDGVRGGADTGRVQGADGLGVRPRVRPESGRAPAVAVGVIQPHLAEALTAVADGRAFEVGLTAFMNHARSLREDRLQ
jgi:hypothetical protein